jgi:glycerol kinase
VQTSTDDAHEHARHPGRTAELFALDLRRAQVSTGRMTILAIDQGTTGSTALVLADDGRTLGRATVDFEQHFPKPGWVEHDPEQIWASVRGCVQDALKSAGVPASSIDTIGITNQRETTVLWERSTQRAIHRAIVWQCRRTADACDALKRAGMEPEVRAKTGLVLDAYFSGTKVAWILDHVDGARARALTGELAFGTIDSFLVSRLSGGEAHVTDVSNASRTLLFNIHTLSWDDALLEVFNVPRAVLPRVCGSAEVVARTKGLDFLPDGIPIAGIAGDQQAALFGQGCIHEGDAKCTYGTGAFLLVNIGSTPRASKHGLITTVAWRIGNQTVYALEGSAFIAGAAVQWLRDGLGLIADAAEIESLAASVKDTGGVAFVPALAGLGAPYWDPDARGTITGITRGTTKAHLARAVLNGMALQVDDLLRAMSQDAERPIERMRVDGGATANNLLMQLQADLSAVNVERPKDLESTGRGAAMLAGIGVGKFDLATAARIAATDRSFSPEMSHERRAEARKSWAVAIRQSRVKTDA